MKCVRCGREMDLMVDGVKGKSYECPGCKKKTDIVYTDLEVSTNGVPEANE